MRALILLTDGYGDTVKCLDNQRSTGHAQGIVSCCTVYLSLRFTLAGLVRAEKKTIRFKTTIERVRRVCAGSFVKKEEDEGFGRGRAAPTGLEGALACGKRGELLSRNLGVRRRMQRTSQKPHLLGGG